MNRIKNSTLIIFLFSVSSLFSQEIMTLEKCRELALENNRQIIIAQQNKEKASTTVQMYRTNFLPKFSARGLGYYTNLSSDFRVKMDPMNLFDPTPLQDIIPPNLYPIIDNLSRIAIPDVNLNLKTNNTYMAGVNLEQPIFMGGKIMSAYKMSKIGDEIADLNKHLTESEVIVQTDEAYWLYVKTGELLKSAEKYKEVVDEFYRVVENARKEGMKSKNDVLKVQVKLNEAELQVLQASNGTRLARMNLCHIIGKPLLSEVVLPEVFQEPLFSLDQDVDITARPEVAMLNKQVELKELEKKLVRSDFLPNIGVSGGYNYMYGVKLNDELLFNNTSLSAIVSVKIPLFQWGEGAKKIRIANTEKIIAEMQREDATEKMQLELMQSINAYEETLLEVMLTSKSVQQAEENLRVSRNQYDAGLETLADYLEAQTIWQKADSDLINAKAALRLCESRYMKAAGLLQMD